MKKSIPWWLWLLLLSVPVAKALLFPDLLPPIAWPFVYMAIGIALIAVGVLSERLREPPEGG
jgi:hypothetical protein